MKAFMKRRIAVLVVGVLFILAVIPAFYPVEDDALRRDCPFCKAYGQLFTVLTSLSGFEYRLGWTRLSPSLDLVCCLPNALPSSPETRAPPA